MKHLLSILLICSIGLTQELTVDGNLNVTGNIQNQTIDSLLQVIADLQSQLSVLQVDNKLETRVYELPRMYFQDSENILLNIPDITGHELEYAELKIINVSDFQIDNEICEVSIKSYYQDHEGGFDYSTSQIKLYNGGGVRYEHNLANSIVYDNTQGGVYFFFQIASGWIDLALSVTAPFSTDSDVQQRKTGLQSKDKKKVE